MIAENAEAAEIVNIPISKVAGLTALMRTSLLTKWHTYKKSLAVIIISEKRRIEVFSGQ